MEKELEKLRAECAALKEENAALKEEIRDDRISMNVTPLDFVRNLIDAMHTDKQTKVEMAEEVGEYLLVYARHNKRKWI